MQDGLALIVTKCDILEAYFAFDIGNGDVQRGLCRLRLVCQSPQKYVLHLQMPAVIQLLTSPNHSTGS